MNLGRIRNKLEKLVLLIVILPMSVLLLTCFYAWVAYLENRIRVVVEGQGRLTLDTLSGEMAGYTEFLKALTPPDTDWVPRLYEEVSHRSMKAVGAIFDDSGLRFSSYPFPSERGQTPSQEWGIFPLTTAKPGDVVFLAEKVTFHEDKKSSFTVARQIDGGGSYPTLWVALYLVLDEAIGSLPRSGVPVNLVVTDLYDRVVYSDDPFFVDSLGKLTVQHRVTGSPLDFLVTTHERASFPLKVYSMTSLAEIHQMEAWGLGTMLGVALLGLVFFLVLSRVLVQGQMRPVESLLTALEQYSQGNFDVRLDIRSHDEFEILGSRFNQLLAQQTETISRLLIETNAAKEAEIRQLEAQFNPHFLFNTIDSVSWMLRLHRNEPAIETLSNLASVLRYSIGRTSDHDFSTLKQDLVYLKIYLRIMKTCLDGELLFSLHIDRGLLLLPVPKLLVQPLVENAIKHGKVADRPLKLTIGYHSAPETQRMIIEIADNGRGFPTGQEAWISGEDPANPSGFGISSIVRRLRLLYGTNFQFHISSRPESGTTVRLYLPQRR